MTGYSVIDITLVAWLAVCICAVPLIGFWIASIHRIAVARSVAWAIVVLIVSFVERMSTSEPSGTRMLLIIVALLWSMKSVVYVETRHHGRCVLTFWQWLGFCVGWFGMRAETFKNVPREAFADWQTFVWLGLKRVVIGVALAVAAWKVAHGDMTEATEIDSWRLWTSTVLLMLGLSLGVHFGLFNILAGIWRHFGARCSSLFRAPLLSESLSEFWGRRWNLAFSEMTALAVFRPLKRLPGRSQQVTAFATVGGFLFSGFLHELAISVPVGAGFGLPTLYFVINGIGMVLEKRVTFSDSILLRRAWTSAWVILPMPILFHRPFLEGCVWPIIGI